MTTVHFRDLSDTAAVGSHVQLTDAVVKVRTTYTYNGVDYETVLEICYWGVLCPACDEIVKTLTAHPMGRGLICTECRERVEVQPV